ncbi:hypothetical protein [Coleofasciculus sp.]
MTQGHLDGLLEQILNQYQQAFAGTRIPYYKPNLIHQIRCATPIGA